MAISPSGVGGSISAGVSNAPADASFPPAALSSLIFQESTVALTTNTPALIVPPSASRVYLAIYSPTPAHTLNLASRRVNVGAGVGIVSNSATPFVLNWASNGSAVNEGWYGNNSANTTVLVHQIFYRPADIGQTVIDDEEEPYACGLI